MVYTLDEIARRIKPVAEKYHLKAVYVFGSYARGEATEESDIDFLVDLDGSGVKGLRFFTVLQDLEDATQKRIDMVTEKSLYQKSYESFIRSDRLFRNNVERERIKIYG